MLAENTIPWAALGAACAGIGSLLSGYAALKIARRQGREEAEHETDPDSDG